jgi:predicted dehydrogenase
MLKSMWHFLTMNTSLSVGIVGIGGYAGTHIDTLRTLQGGQLCRLAAACDPFAGRFPNRVRALAADGIDILDDFDVLLARTDIEAIVVTTPIHLHAAQAVKALNAGKAVYIEKPPCSTIGQWSRIVEARKKANLPCVVGFQMQTSPAMKMVRKGIAEGTWGTLQSIRGSVRWNRQDSYYNRSAWAAKWRIDGNTVFDGPATNALAHAVHAALSLAGKDGGMGEIERVRGSLMRARPIESYDSVLMEVETTHNVPVRLAFTHATPSRDSAGLVLEFEKASVRLGWNEEVHVTPKNGLYGEAQSGGVKETEIYAFSYSHKMAATADFLNTVRTGQRGLLSTVEETLPYLQATNGALQSSGGATFFDAAWIGESGTGKEHFYTVVGLDEQMAALQQDFAAELPVFDIESKPWIEAEDIAPELPENLS